MQTTIELNDDLFTQAQQLAEGEHITLSRLIEEALAHRLRSAPVKRRPPLPVYEGKGGLAATVADNLTHKALLDAADEVGNT